jgi:hypothetical protein
LAFTQEALVRQLNPLLRGWANYYRNRAAKATFAKFDYYVAAAYPHQAHRMERLEPYEGKLSLTVLRGGWAGNGPPLLGGSG